MKAIPQNIRDPYELIFFKAPIFLTEMIFQL